jgi:phage baseplate assembly protein V
MGKNILSDTDFTKGHDTRFANTAVIGFVTKIECDAKHANVRVIMPDRLDHQGTPLISRPVPVMQTASQSKKSYAIPRLGTPVVMVKLPNSTSDYLVIGSFYTPKNPPPVSDPKLDYTLYDDGSIMQFDSSNGQLTWKLKGTMLWDNESGGTFKFKDAVIIDAQGSDISIQTAGGTILVDGATVHLKGDLIFEGNITHTGNMTTSGVHTDSLGHHTGATREDLLERIKALETRIAALERRQLS